jgi:hypothetical protein
LATWTPAALSSERRRASGTCWRVVEAQHVVSTMALADTLEEQALLEEILDDSKPLLPQDCHHLHYLLSTPFRYAAPYPQGSRFRRPGLSPGVFYASQQAPTAVAEMAFYRLLFYAESPATPWPQTTGQYTAFAVKYATPASIDLTMAPFDREAAKWLHATDYSHCQSLADAARQSGIEVIRYQSARAGYGRSGALPVTKAHKNVAILACRAFASREPDARQNWRMHIGAVGIRAVCAVPPQRLAFDRAAFARDPRIAKLNWDR